MIRNETFPFCGFFGVYYTFCSFIPFVTNERLFFICIIFTIFVQTVFVERFFPYNTYFKTEHKLVHYFFPFFKDHITKN